MESDPHPSWIVIPIIKVISDFSYIGVQTENTPGTYTFSIRQAGL